MYHIIGADGREYGPVSRETLRQWIGENRANAQTLVRAEGAAGWQALGTLAEFAGACGGGGAPAETPKPPVAGYAPIAPLPVRRTNGLAIASLVMGLLAITCGCCCCYGFPFNVLGVVFALIALAQIHGAPEAEEGRALAIIGLVLSLLSVLCAVALGLFGFLAALPDLARGTRHW